MAAGAGQVRDVTGRVVCSCGKLYAQHADPFVRAACHRSLVESWKQTKTMRKAINNGSR